MAKQVNVPLDAGRSFAEAAAVVLRTRAGELFAHSDRVLDTSDVEGVHDMRVATRRLRAALEVFAPCFKRRELKPVLRDVKRLADALGERRDPDVWIEECGALAGQLGVADAAGVRALMAGLQIEQAAANVRLAAALDEASRGDLAGRLIALAESAR